jgi:hypothetical protein
MDPEDLREIISAYHKSVAQTVRRFGGFVATPASLQTRVGIATGLVVVPMTIVSSTKKTKHQRPQLPSATTADRPIAVVADDGDAAITLLYPRHLGT